MNLNNWPWTQVTWPCWRRQPHPKDRDTNPRSAPFLPNPNDCLISPYIEVIGSYPQWHYSNHATVLGRATVTTSGLALRERGPPRSRSGSQRPQSDSHGGLGGGWRGRYRAPSTAVWWRLPLMNGGNLSASKNLRVESSFPPALVLWPCTWDRGRVSVASMTWSSRLKAKGPARWTRPPASLHSSRSGASSWRLDGVEVGTWAMWSEG
jgi:hypothetical protein